MSQVCGIVSFGRGKLHSGRRAYPSHLVVLPKCSELLFPRNRSGCWDFAAVSPADFSGRRKREGPEYAGAF